MSAVAVVACGFERGDGGAEVVSAIAPCSMMYSDIGVVPRSDPRCLSHSGGSRPHYRGVTEEDVKVPMRCRWSSRCDARMSGHVLRWRRPFQNVVVRAHKLLAHGTLPGLWQ